MILTYQYKIKPNAEQEAFMRQTLELLRRHWNFALAERLDCLRRTRCQIDRCSLVSEPIGAIPNKVTYYTQQSALKETKLLFPEYKNIYSEVQQGNLQRLDKAWQKWLIPDATGKRGGRPKFKKQGELRSFVYPRVNCEKAGVTLDIENGTIKISKIGIIPIVLHRPIPDGFTLKTCILVLKADGWYACISIQDETIPLPMPIDTVQSAVGVDVGLKEFLVTSEGEVVPIQQHYRNAQKSLANKQKRASRKKKGSKNHQKALNKVARQHQKVARTRQQFHYETAWYLCRTYNLIAIEDLNIKGLAKTWLAKSILDAAWGAFIKTLEAVAVKCGNWVVKVNPYGTSQNCSSCGKKVPKDLSVRTHECPHCGTVLDRDENAAINILNKALNTVGLAVSACGGLEVTLPTKQESDSVKVRSPRYSAA
jgi:putative transposase